MNEDVTFEEFKDDVKRTVERYEEYKRLEHEYYFLAGRMTRKEIQELHDSPNKTTA